MPRHRVQSIHSKTRRMKKIIEFLIARYNKKNPRKMVRLAESKPFLRSLQDDLEVYNAMAKSNYKIQNMDRGSLIQTVGEYNATSSHQLEVVEPTSYRTSKTSALDIKQFEDKDPKFLQNIIAEKLYDMRHAMVDRLWSDEGAFRSKVTMTDKELKLQITLNVYNDGKKDFNGELAGDGVLDAEESDRNTDDGSGSGES